LDEQIRYRLRDSLLGVADACVEAGIDARPIQRAAAAAPAGPVSPLLFALHAGLVEAILDEDAAAAELLLAGLDRRDGFAAGDGVDFVTTDDAVLGIPGAGRLYADLAIDDPEAGVFLAPLAPAELAEASRGVGAAFDLIETAAPELAAEIGAIVRQVVLVGAAPGSERDFGGASSFHLWGAVLLNAHRHRGRVAMAEGLVHEAAHLLLFGEAAGGRVVENDDGERHVSPLRDDPRPLDGIAHATFVLARMAYWSERLLASADLTATERAEAETALDRNRRDYGDGAAVVERHARLTEAGARMLGAAAIYMSRLT
jgi:hypothetical protein